MRDPYELAKDILQTAEASERFTSIDLYGTAVHENAAGEFPPVGVPHVPLSRHHGHRGFLHDHRGNEEDPAEHARFTEQQIEIIKQIHTFVTEHFSEHHTIEELAERFEMSPTVLKKCFRGVYGDSIYSYRKLYRLQVAERLLKESKLTVGEIAAQIGYLNPNKTVLVIAHRMRTVENADKIVVLADGVVAESGTHTELMQKNGLYAKLVNLQTASAEWKLK